MLPSLEVESRLLRGLTHEPPDYFTAQSWKGYRSILTTDARPGLEDVVTPESDIVVHPGYWMYMPDHRQGNEDTTLVHGAHILRLRQNVQEAILAQRSILVFTPVDHRAASLRAIGLSTYEKLLLVPNYRKTDKSGATDLHLYLLGIENEKIFWSRLTKVVRRAKIYGEYGNGCVSAVEMNLKAYGVHVVRDPNTIFDYPQELLEK